MSKCDPNGKPSQEEEVQYLTINPDEVPTLHIGSFILSFDPLVSDEFFLEKAKSELRETPEVVEQALRELRLLLQGEPDLRVPDHEEFFQKFLRPCKWYANSAFALIKRYYRFRMNHQQLCHNLLPSNEKAVFVSDMFVPLPVRMKTGSRVFWIQSGRKWVPKVVPINQVFKAVMLMLDAAMAEPKTQIAGVHVVLDMDGFSLSQVMYFTPSFAAMLTEWVQKCLPCRLKGIHIVNQPMIFNMVFAVFKPFLQEKTRKRIHFHGTDRSSLKRHIDAEVLPTCFGGEYLMPSESVGEGIWKYFCAFDKNFEVGNTYGYTKNKGA